MLPSKDIVSIVLALMPGFLAAWVFYGLTAHPKKDSFERTVQALIFTAIIRALLSLVRFACLQIGQNYSFGAWTEDVELTWSLAIGLAFGFIVAGLANNNTVHLFLWSRKWNFRKRPANEPIDGWVWTKRTAYPNEWYSAFNCENERYVVLQLKSGQRLYGWAEEWPDLPDSGHFVMTEAEWLATEGYDAVNLSYSVSRLLIAASDVEHVEFVKNENERIADMGAN